MKTVVKVIAWVVGTITVMLMALLLSYTVTTYILEHAPQENSKRLTTTVYEVCEMSRAVVNGELEEACGQAQLVSDTEYLCDIDNKGNAICWVEDKR